MPCDCNPLRAALLEAKEALAYTDKGIADLGLMTIRLYIRDALDRIEALEIGSDKCPQDRCGLCGHQRQDHMGVCWGVHGFPDEGGACGCGGFKSKVEAPQPV